MKKVTKMKFVYAALLSIAMLQSYGQKNVLKSFWVEQPKNTDGNLSDWKLPFKSTDDNSKLSYCFANDSAYLYICITTDEQLTQNKISMAGANIWLDGSGKKLQTCGIGFPVPSGHHPGPPSEGTPGQTFDMGKVQQQILKGFDTIKLRGLNNIPDKIVPLKNEYGVQAAIKWDDVTMTIEYKIPLTVFNRPADTTKAILVCIELPALDISNMPQGPPHDMEGGMGGPPPGEGGGPEGDMGGEGMGPPPGGGFNEMAKADVIWVKLKLANY